MSLTIQHGGLDNWFVLVNERGQRINGADIEGSREEWEDVAACLERGERARHKRVAFFRDEKGWAATSPRNSINETRISDPDIARLPAEIRRVLAETPVVDETYGEEES